MIEKLLLFPNAQEARDYRHEKGTGGWIFTSEKLTILFPPHYAPIDIFTHPITKGRSGDLIGAM